MCARLFWGGGGSTAAAAAAARIVLGNGWPRQGARGVPRKQKGAVTFPVRLFLLCCDFGGFIFCFYRRVCRYIRATVARVLLVLDESEVVCGIGVCVRVRVAREGCIRVFDF